MLMALIPFFFGIIVEFMQSEFTKNRKGEFLDMISDTGGVFSAMFLWLFLRPYHFLKKSKLPPPEEVALKTQPSKRG